MEQFEQIAAVIVLVSSVLIAIDKIFDILGKPVLWTKSKVKRDKEINSSLEIIQKDITEIKALNQKQNATIELIQRADLDMLRQNIIYIYNHHKKQRHLNESEREYLDDLYKDYTLQGGNSYIKKIYERIAKWEVIPDDEED